jgi:sugar O-acyltransferase (sialic acid O-acetyltransferase NeuD family)
MSQLPVIVVGAGGHGLVVADALLSAGRQLIGFTDADAALHGTRIAGVLVLGDDDVLLKHTRDGVQLANGIGGVGRPAGEPVRRRVQERLASDGWRFTDVRHPSAIVSPLAQIEPGAQLLAASVVQPGARVGVGAIVNTGAVVEHDTSVGAWTHVAPRALLCGDVHVGELSHIGAGAVVRQGLRIGARTTIGAGAVVVRDFAGDGVLVGVPAAAMRLMT